VNLDPIVDKLAQKIADITIDAEVKPDAIFEALRIVFMFWMSRLCSHCRHSVAHKLMAEIPAMLECANRASNRTPTCH